MTTRRGADMSMRIARRSSKRRCSTTLGIAPRYVVRDQLRHERTAVVPADRIVPVVSAWLSELGAVSPLVEKLAEAVQSGDWPIVHALSESLAVEVTVAD